jgi:chaperonin GroES
MDGYNDMMVDETEPVDELTTDVNQEPDRLTLFAQSMGDISEHLTDDELMKLGAKVCDDYDRDYEANTEWREQAEKALKAAAQEKAQPKDYPFPQASNIKWPAVTVASQQFAARAYPAIVKGDEVVGFKVLGRKPGNDASEEQKAFWQSKKARAERVRDWMNYRIMYGMPDWEGDMDFALNQIPVVGMGFKKIYKSPRYGVCSEYISAFHVTVHPDTKSLDTCPRITHDYELYPYEIMRKIKRGDFADISKDMQTDSEDDQAPDCILEQHCLLDLDDDDIEEPYIVTVHKDTRKVLRIEAAYGEADVIQMGGQVVDFVRFNAFIAIPFIPDPRGRFYALGFGALLDVLCEAINTSLNQLNDAGHAQVAGGGFVAAGLRIQGGGQASTLRFKPGEYKQVSAPGQDIRAQIFERTLPQPSAVLFELLGMLIDAAKDVSAVKDVLTGDAPTNAPVGTTMALIEQGLQSFTAIYKRMYRALKAEFKQLFWCESKWGGEEARIAYQEFFDGDPEADFDKDFDPKGYDIVPVSDPTVITQAQKLAKSQYLLQFIADPRVNGQEIIKRALEAGGIEDIDEIIVPPQANPMAEEAAKAELDKTKSEAERNQAQALKYVTEAGVATGQAEIEGVMNDTNGRGLPSMAGTPGDEMGDDGLEPEGGAMPGSMEPELMGDGLEPDELGGGEASPYGV